MTELDCRVHFAEDTDATNELINDEQAVQPLTVGEIEALKQSGANANVRRSVNLEMQILISVTTGDHSEADRAACHIRAQDGVQ